MIPRPFRIYDGEVCVGLDLLCCFLLSNHAFFRYHSELNEHGRPGAVSASVVCLAIALFRESFSIVRVGVA